MRKRRSRLRSLAYAIIEHRYYVTFPDEAPRYLFDDLSTLPRRYRKNRAWLSQHIDQPTIRMRLRWPTYKQTTSALPKSLRVDNRLW